MAAVWIHAVSVGEVTAAAPIVACLKRKAEVEIIFQLLRNSREMAKKFIKEAAHLFISSGYSRHCAIL